MTTREIGVGQGVLVNIPLKEWLYVYVFILYRQRPCDDRYVVQGGLPNVCKVPEPSKRMALDRNGLSLVQEEEEEEFVSRRSSVMT
jgi:hypothetical protein